MLKTIKKVGVTDEFIPMFAKDAKIMQDKYFNVLFENLSNFGFSKRLTDAVLPIFMEHFHISESDVKSRYVLSFHLAGMISLFTDWLLYEQNISVEELGEIVQGVMTKGILDTLQIKSD